MSDFATPCTAAHQGLLSMGFPRQEHWRGLPYPSMWHDLFISPIVSERHVGCFQHFITSRARIPYPQVPGTCGNGSVGWLPGQGCVWKRSSCHRGCDCRPTHQLPWATPGSSAFSPLPCPLEAGSGLRAHPGGHVQGCSLGECRGVEITHTESRPGPTEGCG